MLVFCACFPAFAAFGFDAAECGFSPDATGTENAAALQAAFDRGGTVTVMKPGRYRIAHTVFIGDNTSLTCGNGVVFVKTNEGKAFSHLILNKGALTKTWNRNIEISGLEISVNGMDHLDWQVYGLAGQIAFFHVKDLRINRFRCYDLASEQYCIHVCAFEDLIVDDVIIHGKKDGVHLGRGKRFTIRNGVFYTGDDPIALNAHDYSIGNPELGWIENGVIENCHDLGNCNNTRIGFFCRILAGAWVDWFEGMSVQESDTVVSNGSLYRVAVGPNGKNYVSKTRPTHRKGRQTYDEGIVWAHVQDEVVYNCGVRNVVFRDCFLYQPRTAAFSVHFDIGEWSRSYYPDAPIPVQEGISFENVQVLYADPSPFINTVTPVDSMTLVNCRLNQSNIIFDGNSPVKDYGVTKLQLIGCRFSARGDWTLVDNTVPHKKVKLVMTGSMKDHDDLNMGISKVGTIDVKSDVIGIQSNRKEIK